MKIKVINDFRDLKQLVHIEESVLAKYEEAGYSDATDSKVRLTKNYETYAKNNRIFVAHKNNQKAIGFAIVDFYNKNLHLEELKVAPEYSQKGVGTLLINTIIEFASKKNFYNITLRQCSNMPICFNFYKRCGFQIIPDGTFSYLKKIIEIEKYNHFSKNNMVSMSFKLRQNNRFSYSYQDICIKPISKIHEEYLRLQLFDQSATKWTGFANLNEEHRFQRLLTKWKYQDLSPLGEWIIENEDNQAIGWAMLKYTNDATPEIGYLVSKSIWGQGYGYKIGKLLDQYAFKELALSKIKAQCCLANTSSIKILEKIGMSKINTNGEMVYFEKTEMR